MMSERKLRRVVAETLKRLGQGDGDPNTVSDDLIARLMLSLYTGRFLVIAENKLSAAQSAAVVGSLLEFVAMTNPTPKAKAAVAI
jgi:hypothetical protein